MKRRNFLMFAGTGLAMSLGRKALAAGDRPARLVLVHGRSQQGFDPAVLKSTWLETLKYGAAKINRTVPDQLDVAFPFYGTKLDDFARQFEKQLQLEKWTQQPDLRDFESEDSLNRLHVAEERRVIEFAANGREIAPCRNIGAGKFFAGFFDLRGVGLRSQAAFYIESRAVQKDSRRLQFMANIRGRRSRTRAAVHERRFGAAEFPEQRRPSTTVLSERPTTGIRQGVLDECRLVNLR